MSVIITLDDGNQYQYNHPVSPLYISQNINFALSKFCIAAKINGNLVDIHDIIEDDAILEFITTKDALGMNIIRCSCAHLLGYAIKKLWPTTKMVTSGNIEDIGFYYDVDSDYHFTTYDLTKLEQYMLFLANKNYNIIKKNVTWKQAQEVFLSLKETYKIFFLNENFKYQKFQKLYYQETYVDICQGPHVPNIKFCRYFKLCKISNSYWDKNNDNKRLQRIYGIACANQQQLTTHIHESQHATIKDHRNLSKQLHLYHIQKEAPGMIFWHDNGWILFQELKKFIRVQLKKYEYQEVKSPIMMNYTLWKKTGHWDNYQEHIFSTTSENHTYCIKPMNCPGHVQIFNQGIKSYKDLPIRMAEFGHCHRNEPSGSLHGLMRIREFTQDDAHIFCTQTQIYDELNHCLHMMFDIYKIFGFKQIQVKLSTRPKKRIGNDAMWDVAEKYLFNTLQYNKIKFEHQPHDGAFYGPKIEFILLDSFNRTWQCGTIQLDFSLPALLNAHYIDNNNDRITPVIIHRAILGSMERFIGLLTEEYSGFFPTWLAPIQVVLITVNARQAEYVATIEKKLINHNIRVHVDLRNEKISLKIRFHTIQRVPYMLIIGEKEVQQKTISIRTYKGKKLENYHFDLFLEKLQHEIYNYNLHQLEE